MTIHYEQRADHVMRMAQELCGMASSMGVVVTIERKALTPLAMGHAEYVVGVREARPLAANLLMTASNAQDLLNDEAHQLSLKLAAQFDAEVAKAIDKRMGGRAWSLDEMRGRLHEVVMPNGWSELRLDDEPLLLVSAIDTQFVNGVMTVTRYFRQPS